MPSPRYDIHKEDHLKAVTTLQALVRGYLARKGVQVSTITLKPHAAAIVFINVVDVHVINPNLFFGLFFPCCLLSMI
jgi:hypothetical protein